jgi:carbon dioxide concentrating mechanism protein CcmN
MLIKLRAISREVVSVHLYGNVSIDPSAVIAPGVLLQADENHRISIGAGVCIGAGTIVQAAGGNLYIEAGVCLGRGVLIVGSGSIDRDACIGAGTTVIDPQIEAGAMIPPHSLLGDRSRSEVSVVKDRDFPENLRPPTPSATDPWDSPAVDASVAHNYIKVKTPEVSKQTEHLPTQIDTQTTPSSPSEPATDPPMTTAIQPHSTNFVAGRAQFDRIKRALFSNSGNNDDTAST